MGKLDTLPELVGRRDLLRRGLRLAVGGGLALGVGGLLVPQAEVVEAAEDMCDGDPVLLIDGKQPFQIVIWVPVSKVAMINAGNPVRIQIWVPSNATAVVTKYNSPFAERVEFIAAAPKTAGAAYNIQFKVLGPQPSGVAQYQLRYRAWSAIEVKDHFIKSGGWSGDVVNVPR